MIPPQLCKPEFRFVLLKPKEKVPFERDWQHNGYTYNNPKLLAHIQTGGNYGVIGGYGRLRMIDVDNPGIVQEFERRLGRTFSVRTGSGGRHFYILCDYDTNHVFIPANTGEYRAKNYQVVGAGCTHPNGNKYEIALDAPIKEYTSEEMQKILEPFLRAATQNNAGTQEQTSDTTRSGLEFREVLRLLRLRKSDEEIMQHMMSFAKWSTAPQQYRELTLQKAKNTHEQREAKKAEKHKIHYDTPEGLQEEEKKLREAVLVELARKSIEGDIEARDLVVQYIIANEHLLARRSDNNPVLYIYDRNTGIYVPDGKSYLRELIERVCTKAFKVRFANEIIERVTIRSFVNDEELFKVKDPHRIVVANGVLNLLSKELSGFDPEMREFVRIPVEYNPEAKKDVYVAFLESCGHDEKTIKQLVEFAGYTLVRNYRIPRALIMNGSGRNGKEVWGWILQNLVGLENVAHIGIHELNEDHFAKQYLQHRLLNISGELPERDLETSEAFKQTTGETRITADIKHEKAVSFISYAKHVFACNQLPKAVDQTPAFWYRLLLTTWSKRFVTKEEYEELADVDKANYGIKDSTLRETLTTPEALSGLLNWCLEVLPALLERGDYYGVPRPEDVQKMYNRRAQDIETFWEDCCEYNSAVSGDTKEALYAAYKRFCSDELNIMPKQDNAFWRKSKETQELNTTHTTVEGKRLRVVSGWVVRFDKRVNL